MDEELVGFYCQKCGREIKDVLDFFGTENRPLCYDCYTRERYVGEADEKEYEYEACDDDWVDVHLKIGCYKIIRKFRDKNGYDWAVVEDRSDGKNTIIRHLGIDENGILRNPETGEDVTKDQSSGNLILPMAYLYGAIAIVIICIIFGFISLLR